MDVGNLKHDPKIADRLLIEMEDGSVIAKRDFEIHLPKRFVDSGMAEVGETVTTPAVLGLVIPGDSYAPLMSLMDITLVPLSIREVAIKGTQYLVLEFTKGDTVIDNINVLQEPNHPYAYYMEFLYYAKRPWYVTENALSSMFDLAASQSGDPVGSSPQVMRVYMSLMFRDPDNLEKPYRYSKAMLEGRPPVIVGLNNSGLLIDGTFPKIMGGYQRDNTVAAIVNPDDRVTDLEKIIKGVPV